MSEYEIKTMVKENDGHSYTRHFYLSDNLGIVDHKEDGPAVIVVDKFDGVTTEYWYHHGQLHRLDGPAVVETIDRDEDGKRVQRKHEQFSFLLHICIFCSYLLDK